MPLAMPIAATVDSNHKYEPSDAAQYMPLVITRCGPMRSLSASIWSCCTFSIVH